MGTGVGPVQPSSTIATDYVLRVDAKAEGLVGLTANARFVFEFQIPDNLLVNGSPSPNPDPDGNGEPIFAVRYPVQLSADYQTFEFNLANGTLDGSLGSQGNSFANFATAVASGTPIVGFSMFLASDDGVPGWGRDTGNALRYDNVRFVQIPEPSALALLGLPLLAIARRRN